MEGSFLSSYMGGPHCNLFHNFLHVYISLFQFINFFGIIVFILLIFLLLSMIIIYLLLLPNQNLSSQCNSLHY